MALKILLADDSMTAQNMGKKILMEAGYEVVAVSNGAAAVKKIAEVKPDLAVLDVYMPGYTGLEVCERVRGAAETAKMPVLLTVGKMEPFKPEDAARVKADGVIVKPFEASDLLAAVKKIDEKLNPPPKKEVPEYEQTIKLTRPIIPDFGDETYHDWKSTAEEIIEDDQSKSKHKTPEVAPPAAVAEAAMPVEEMEPPKPAPVEVPAEIAAAPAVMEMIAEAPAVPVEDPGATAVHQIEEAPAPPPVFSYQPAVIPENASDPDHEETVVVPPGPAPVHAVEAQEDFDKTVVIPPAVSEAPAVEVAAPLPVMLEEITAPPAPAPAPAMELETTATPSVEPVRVEAPPEIEYTSARDTSAVSVPASDPAFEPTISQDHIEVSAGGVDPALVTDPSELSQFVTKVGVENPGEPITVGLASEVPGVYDDAHTGDAVEVAEAASEAVAAEVPAEAPVAEVPEVVAEVMAEAAAPVVEAVPKPVVEAAPEPASEPTPAAAEAAVPATPVEAEAVVEAPVAAEVSAEAEETMPIEAATGAIAEPLPPQPSWKAEEANLLHEEASASLEDEMHAAFAAAAAEHGPEPEPEPVVAAAPEVPVGSATGSMSVVDGSNNAPDLELAAAMAAAVGATADPVIKSGERTAVLDANTVTMIISRVVERLKPELIAEITRELSAEAEKNK